MESERLLGAAELPHGPKEPGYQPPAVEWEEPFEPVAASGIGTCDPGDPGYPNC